ncbi:NAD-binding of NADP-dependent 3-hydroxyisobutyrate dehydrogenase-domain-containing protein [Aspergillus crustosus]
MGSLGSPISIGFIGLGAMGIGMSLDLQRRLQYTVTGFDIWQPSLDKFVAQGGRAGKSPADVAQSSQILLCMAATAQQLDSILFDGSAIQALPKNGTIVLCSTVPPSYYTTLPSRIASLGRPDVEVVDAPVSGGTLRAANGTLSIFAASSPEGLTRATSLLDDMSGQLYIISGGLGAASKIKMINQLLVGTNIAAASEAIALATKAGLNTREVFDIIQRTSGSSWAWGNRVPHMLEEDWTPLSALNIFVKDMGIVVSTGRATQFPLPIASVAEQLYISAAAKGWGKEDDAGLVRLFLHGTRVSKTGQSQPASTAKLLQTTPTKVAVIGLDDLGSEIAASFARSGFNVHAFADNKKAASFLSTNPKIISHNTLTVAAQGADVLLLRVREVDEATDLLFGAHSVAEALTSNAVILLSATVSPSQVRGLEKRLVDLDTGIALLDFSVLEHGPSKNKSSPTVLYSGTDAAISRASGILTAAQDVFDNVLPVSGEVGSASTVKLIDQLLSGVHLLAAAEGLAFASHLGLNTSQIFDFIGSAAAWSWILETRVPRMLKAAWAPDSGFDSKSGSASGSGSPLSILARDLGLALEEARNLPFWAPMTSAAHNLFLAAVTKGWAGEADAGVVRLYETESVNVARSS